MKEVSHILEKHYIDGSINGYIDPRGIVSSGTDIPAEKIVPEPKSVLNPFLSGEDEFTPSRPFSASLQDDDARYLDIIPTFYSEEEELKKKKENRERASRRASHSVEDICRSHIWFYFLTLTIGSDCGIDRYNYDDCYSCCQLFLKNLRRQCPGVCYVLVPEQHHDGAYHFHALIGNCDLSSMLSDSGKKAHRQPVYNFRTGWRYGFSTVTKVRKQGAVGRYIAKYITKEMAVPKGRKRYLASNNLKRTKDILVRRSFPEYDAYVAHEGQVGESHVRHFLSFPDNAILEAIQSGFFTDGVVPDRVRASYVPILGRYVYYYEIYGSEDMLCA